MTRLHFDADDRAGLIAELTEQRLRAWNRDLLAGVQPAITELRNAILPQLTQADVTTIFIQAVSDLDGAEHRLSLLAAKAMYAAAQAEATRIVDAMVQTWLQPAAAVTGSAA